MDEHKKVPLEYLYRQTQSAKDPLRLAASIAVFEVELERRWKEFKQALKDLGYKRVTVGAHRTWRLRAATNMVFAEPPIRSGTNRSYGRVALWTGPCDILGGMGCGNGMYEADQAQLFIHPNVLARYEGEHIL